MPPRRKGRPVQSRRRPARFNWAAFIVNAVLCGGTAVALLSIGVYKWQQAPAEPASATATVVACYTATPGNACSTGDAVFTVGTTTYHTERAIPYDAHVGDRFTIGYDPGDPERNGDTRTTAVTSFAVGGVALILFVLVLAGLVRHHRRRAG
ncbi:hypothetical protein [Amycolatopsis sp. NPDC004625]|uniref:hypothetical protein n=1 Tax=Amycolatopsis sp. NPDC004625 TaxID=3154670 RepID=UPI0033B36193